MYAQLGIIFLIGAAMFGHLIYEVIEGTKIASARWLERQFAKHGNELRAFVQSWLVEIARDDSGPLSRRDIRRAVETLAARRAVRHQLAIVSV